MDSHPAHVDSQLLTERARAADEDVRARTSRLTGWDIVPFTGDLRAVDLSDPVLPEPPRGGLEQTDCPICAKDDHDYLWSDERWRVRAGNDRSVPVYILEPRAHVDLGQLDDELAADLGRLTVRIERR